jgi:hypothetical protein
LFFKGAALGRKEKTMPNSSPAVEVRFWIPLHLVEAAREAMTPFTVKECPNKVPACGSITKADDCQLTPREIRVLLHG